MPRQVANIIPPPGQPAGAPNVTAEIDLAAAYVLAAGKTLYTTTLSTLFDTGGTQADFFSLTNNGALWNVESGDASIVNAFNFGPIVNTGLVVAQSTGTQAQTFIVTSTSEGLTNSGSIYAIAPNAAYAWQDWSSGPVVENSGLIAAEGAGATDIARWNGGPVVNTATGQILAQGDNAVAVYLGRGHVPVTFEPDTYVADIQNAGLIEAASTSVSTASVAIEVAHLDNETMTILNSGKIIGDFAIVQEDGAFSPPTSGGEVIRNLPGGIIQGDIALGEGGDLLVNQGAITGFVSLAGGADTFDNSDGTLNGLADMGWGDDSFIGGAGKDVAVGDRGDDSLSGGGGNDLLLGGRGDDTLNGGAGNDGLYGEDGADTIFTQGGDYVDAGAGDDTVVLGDLQFAHLDGGAGRDKLVLPILSHPFDLQAALASGRIVNFEEIDLPGAQTLVVRPGDVKTLTGAGQLTIGTTASGAVDLVGAWSSSGLETVGGVHYHAYVSGGATVLVSGTGLISILSAAPAGAAGLDAVASGGAAPLAGSVQGADLDSNTTQVSLVTLAESLTIDPDETWTSPDGTAIISGGVATAFLVNNGVMKSAGDSSGGIVVVDTDYLGGFTNTGTLTAADEDHGARLAASESELKTYGIADSVESNQGNAYGVNNGDPGGPLVNTGTISASSDGTIAAAVNTWFMNLTNKGALTATSSAFVAVGLYAHNGGVLDNSGHITASGVEGAWGVGASTFGLDLTNTGAITATASGSGATSYGVDIDFTSSNSTIVNSGTITASVAIQLGWTGNGGGLTLENTGKINGQILLDIDPNGGPATPDLIVNQGLINGDIHLGGDRDIYVGAGGALQGLASGEDGSDLLIGGAGGDHFDGGAGDDAIIGGGGADVLTGGAGADVFIYTALGDSTAAAPDTITDFQTGTDHIDLSALAPTSVHLSVAGGVTTLTATTSAGNLVIDVDGQVAMSDLILAPLATVTAASGSTLAVGTAGGGVVNGNGGADLLVGASGADTLNDAGGAAVMFGGMGNDTYVVTNPADIVVELPGQGVDAVKVSLPAGWGPTYVIPDNVENLVLVAGVAATGNALDNTMTGNSAANVLDGGLGADTMIGGAGNDTYYVDNAGDLVKENAGEGTDTVNASISYTLPDNVENLTLVAAAGVATATGNALDNLIVGNDAGDTLHGGDGNDIVSGGTGADALYGDAGNDVLNGNGGADVMYGGDGNDQIWGDGGTVTEYGGAGDDQLSGASPVVYDPISGVSQRPDDFARDTFDGGAGADSIDGAGGVDTAIYEVASSQAALTRNGDGTWTVNGGATDGVDKLTAVELLQFTDHEVSLVAKLAQWSDFTGDGHSDLLIENSAGAVFAAAVTGGKAVYTAVTSLGREWSFKGDGDFIGDGAGQSIFTMENVSRAQFLMENGSGALVVADDVMGGDVTFTQVGALGAEWKFVGVGDFLLHGDDQFMIENSAGAVAVGEVLNGKAVYTTVAALGPEWKFVGDGDFLDDGRSQFLVENTAGAVVAGEVVNGAAHYTQVAALGPEWSFRGAGDFLGDGHADFLIENTAGAVFAGEVVNGQAHYTQLTALGAEWKFVGAGDYLGEGHDQFLIENSAGAVVVGDWSGGAMHFTQVASLGPEWLFH